MMFFYFTCIYLFRDQLLFTKSYTLLIGAGWSDKVRDVTICISKRVSHFIIVSLKYKYILHIRKVSNIFVICIFLIGLF